MGEFQKWKSFLFNKISEIKYARIQGKAELEKHFKDTNILNKREKEL